MLGQLAENAVIEHRYLDAGYYNWLLGMQYLCCDLEDKEKLLKNKEKMIKAECFYAYDAINRYFVMFCSHLVLQQNFLLLLVSHFDS